VGAADPALISAAVATAIVILGGLAAWLTVRRTASGKIGTSEAATLWAAQEKFRADTLTRLDKVTEQRDRLLESQTAVLIPIVTGLNDSLRAITESLARLEQHREH
jgi:hypothetical protein